MAYGSPYYYSFDGAIGVAVSPDGEVVVADSTSLYLLGEDGDDVKTIDFNNATGVLFAGDGFYALGEDKVYSISNDFTGVSQISALDGVSLLTYLDGTFYGVIDNSIVTYDDNFTVVS
ncbi:MAG: hypothetical protein IKC64_05175, partial [Clostridia bacterium]|nr:hypothetical protein [Clostridia bacterium]